MATAKYSKYKLKKKKITQLLPPFSSYGSQAEDQPTPAFQTESSTQIRPETENRQEPVATILTVDCGPEVQVCSFTIFYLNWLFHHCQWNVSFVGHVNSLMFLLFVCPSGLESGPGIFPYGLIFGHHRDSSGASSVRWVTAGFEH